MLKEVDTGSPKRASATRRWVRAQGRTGASHKFGCAIAEGNQRLHAMTPRDRRCWREQQQYVQDLAVGGGWERTEGALHPTARRRASRWRKSMTARDCQGGQQCERPTTVARPPLATLAVLGWWRVCLQGGRVAEQPT